jgi:hypothetical protein
MSNERTTSDGKILLGASRLGTEDSMATGGGVKKTTMKDEGDVEVIESDYEDWDLEDQKE